MLEIQQLDGFYDATKVLQQINWKLKEGQIAAILGRNGAGRSSFAKSIVGLINCTGSIQWQGHELIGLPSYKRARLGIAYVPETRDVFPTLSVMQNLVLGQAKKSPFNGFFNWTSSSKQANQFAQEFSFDDVWVLFPSLLKRQNLSAGSLSGGEQQMLSIARAMLRQPSLLIVDEPTEGLAPQVVQQISQALKSYQQKGGTVVLIEQKLNLSLELAQQVVVLGQGQVQWSGNRQEFLAHTTIRQQWLELNFSDS
jgi:branched-chain amino acid transport system ATP-binding protein